MRCHRSPFFGVTAFAEWLLLARLLLLFVTVSSPFMKVFQLRGDSVHSNKNYLHFTNDIRDFFAYKLNFPRCRMRILVDIGMSEIFLILRNPKPDRRNVLSNKFRNTTLPSHHKSSKIYPSIFEREGWRASSDIGSDATLMSMMMGTKN